jgi:hypothetical protein
MRPWNIAEQQVEVEGTKWLLEFTSAHTEALAAGEPAPDHDNFIVLRVWNETRNRYMLVEFDRGGMVKRTSVEAAEPATAPDQGSDQVEGDRGPPGLDGTYDDPLGPVVHVTPAPPREWDNGEQKPFASPVQF